MEPNVTHTCHPTNIFRVIMRAYREASGVLTCTLYFFLSSIVPRDWTGNRATGRLMPVALQLNSPVLPPTQQPKEAKINNRTATNTDNTKTCKKIVIDQYYRIQYGVEIGDIILFAHLMKLMALH